MSTVKRKGSKKTHAVSNPYTRYFIAKGAGHTQKSAGLPAPIFRKIERGEIKKLSHKTFLKLRRAYERESYQKLRSLNVSPQVARSKRSLPAEVQFKYTKLIESGLNPEYADRDLYKVSKTGKLRLITSDEIDRTAAGLDRMARLLVRKNGKAREWKVSEKEAIRRMKLYMSMTAREPGDWDFYVTERKKEHWVPRIWVKDKETRKMIVKLAPPGSAKYTEWQKRNLKGEI